MKINRREIFIVIIFAPLWQFFTTVVHELGHAAVMLYYGGTISEFSIFGPDAYVSSWGAEFTPFGEALLHLSGTLLPCIIVIIIFLLYKRRAKSIAYHLCHVLILLSTILSLLPWVVYPIMSLFKSLPKDEDMAQLISVTGENPLVVAAFALVTIVAFVIFVVKTGVFSRIREFKRD
ncbi:M50 family metallopeptidase [Clostridiaceae bacterium OttesenSCG-928-D20]|nr:M50 family metallopeptidase [Clostridiaceae bacterium OttesenSCG-928-D20]